jgi:hypothetical protein
LEIHRSAQLVKPRLKARKSTNRLLRIKAHRKKYFMLLTGMDHMDSFDAAIRANASGAIISASSSGV